MSGRAVARTFPHDDVAFRAHVEAAQATIGRWDPELIEQEIRKAYPAATVHQASSFGRGGREPETWYVYRDGTIQPPPDGNWWLDETLPRTVMTVQGRYVETNAAAAELFGRPAEAITGAPAGSFTRHEGSAEVARRLFERLAETGSLHSTAVVVRPDGEELRIEFHTRREGDVYVTVMRPTA